MPFWPPCSCWLYLWWLVGLSVWNPTRRGTQLIWLIYSTISLFLAGYWSVWLTSFNPLNFAVGLHDCRWMMAEVGHFCWHEFNHWNIELLVLVFHYSSHHNWLCNVVSVALVDVLVFQYCFVAAIVWNCHIAYRLCCVGFYAFEEMSFRCASFLR